MDTTQSDFPKDWIKIVQFMKYMRGELMEGHQAMEISFSDFVTLFIYLVGR